MKSASFHSIPKLLHTFGLLFIETMSKLPNLVTLFLHLPVLLCGNGPNWFLKKNGSDFRIAGCYVTINCSSSSRTKCAPLSFLSLSLFQKFILLASKIHSSNNNKMKRNCQVFLEQSANVLFLNLKLWKKQFRLLYGHCARSHTYYHQLRCCISNEQVTTIPRNYIWGILTTHQMWPSSRNGLKFADMVKYTLRHHLAFDVVRLRLQ